MKISYTWVAFVILLLQSPFCFSKESINVILIPDPYSCHQIGAEMGLTENSRLGIVAVNNCATDRPTYGSANDDVRNTFSRILIPWTYAPAGAWDNGYFIKVLAGFEDHQFKSTAGSTAEVTFNDLLFHAGYQWYWDNGINLSTSLGLAVLFARNQETVISSEENGDVIEFIDKNTENNQHVGLGIVLGWAF